MKLSLASAAVLAALFPIAAAASPSAGFDQSCANYYRQELDPKVPAGKAEAFCACLADEFEGAGLGTDALDFFGRTYSEDLTTFMHEYPKGEAWMEQSFQAEPICRGEMGATN